MAKHPLMFVSTDDPAKFAQMVAIAAGTAAPTAPVAAAPPPPAAAPPPVAAAAPPPPVAAAAPPPPPVAAPPPPPAPVAVTAPVVQPVVAGGITTEQIVAKMAEKISKPGAAQAVSTLMAQYNSREPGKAGPITNVDPAQYANLSAALDAL